MGLQGVPVRVELGPKDLEKTPVFWQARFAGQGGQGDGGAARRRSTAGLSEHLKNMQTALFEKARKFRDANMYQVIPTTTSRRSSRSRAAFLWAHWDGTARDGDRILCRDEGPRFAAVPFTGPKERASVY